MPQLAFFLDFAGFLLLGAGSASWTWPPQALAQIEHRRVQGLPAPGGPQVQGVAARAAAETVIDVLAQVDGKNAAGCRA